jgi:predicted transcriptional regulator
MEIKDKKRKSAILSALADNEMINILNSTKNEAKSALMIMKIHDISHSTAYRKIKWLLDNGLLVVEKIKITDDGKKFSLLRSTLESVQVTYEDEVNIHIKENVNKVQLTAKQVFSMEDEL